jgi:hypothetical protein
MPQGEPVMWSWLRKQNKAGTPTTGDGLRCENASAFPDSQIASSLGSIADEMKRKGYQGPFVNLCDGITSITFHGPNVPLDPPWLDPGDNPFQMRVVDCEQFCSDSFLYAMGDGAQSIGDSVEISNIDADRPVSAHELLTSVRP